MNTAASAGEMGLAAMAALGILVASFGFAQTPGSTPRSGETQTPAGPCGK